MRLLADPLVDWAALWKVVWVSFLAGVIVMSAFALAVLGAAHSADHRRAGQTVVAAGYTALTVLALAVCAFMLYHGYLFVVHKS